MIEADPSTFDDRLAALRAAGEPTRLRVLWLLGRAELTVTELVTVLGQSQPSVSRHLRVLCDAGLTTRHQEGAFVFYRRAADALVGSLCDELTGPILERDEAALTGVLDERAALARRYFAARAPEWDALRAHYAGPQVEAAMRRSLGEERVGRLVDLGTGTGRMLVALDGLYDSGVGYDVSPEMLAVARVRLQEAGVARARVRRADLFSLGERGDEAGGEAERADLVVLHHVLHFLLRPDEAVAAAARLMAPGGRMLIADFAPHDVEALRERHAHRRLGFASEEIARYATACGLRVEREETVPGEASGLATRLWLLCAPRRAVRREEGRHAAH